MAARSDGSGGGQKNAGTLRIVGIVVLALAAVGVGAWRMGFLPLGTSHNDDSVLANAPETSPGQAGHAATPTRSPAPAGPGAAADLDAPALEPLGGAPGSGGTPAQPTRRPGTRAASSGGSSSAAVTAVAPEAPRGSSQMARLDEHLTYQYTTLNRRDPFQSLLTGEYVAQEDHADPDPGGMKIVGIVWGATDQFAMVEDARGNSYVLRKGDKLQNGFVESLRRDAVVINVTTDGQSQTVVIPFVRKGDANAR
jgi:hypothetical protein